jgi:hypothetical protein
MKRSNAYWFPAKRSGFGWGPPTTWQGVLFFAAWLAVLLGVSLFLKNEGSDAPLVFIGGMISLLLVVLYFKGEPLGRPGKRD